MNKLIEKKTEPPDKIEDKDNNKSYLTISDYITSGNIYDKLKINDYNNIFKFMTDISKNIYNSVIFCNNIFYKFKNQIFYNVQKYFIDNIKNLNCDTIEDIVKDKIYTEYEKYYNLFISSKDNINKNNKEFYKYIKNYISDNKIIIVNNNYNEIKFTIIKKILHDFNLKYTNKEIKNIEFISIVENILYSFYNNNWNTTKNQILNKIKCSIEDEIFINQIKNNAKIVNNKKNCKKDFEELLNDFKFKCKGITDRNLISRFVYRHLGNNINFLPSNIITEIINKSFDGYASYYTLKEKSIKCNFPKYLKKTDKYSLIYCEASFKKENDYIRLTIGEYIAKNFNKITNNNNYVILNENSDTYYKMYADEKFIKKINNSKIPKTKNYIIDDNYIEKNNENIFDGYYLKIKIPKKLKNKKINRIEINPIQNGLKFKINFRYENEEKNNVQHLLTPENSISIDLGQTNLMSIYNPTGDAKIIKGSYITSLNNFYNDKLDNAKRKAKKINNKDTTKNMQSMLINRQNKINDYFDKIVAYLNNNYGDKENIIIGYNVNWKNKVSLGRKGNRTFYNIPYAKLLKKLKNKFGNKIIIKEESYTSKCDALALETIQHQEVYLGKRTKRGLFCSSKNKLLNADINGAINIMRKVINLTEITGQIYNPIRVNIICEVAKPTE